jgi:hypothetical protein
MLTTKGTFKKQQQETEEVTWPPKVTYRNPKTGLVERRDNHTFRVVGSSTSGDRVQFLEYPAGSGNLFNAKMEAVGRWDKTKPEGQRYLKNEPHVEWNPPETDDVKLARALAEKDVKIQALEKELAHAQAERSAEKVEKKKTGV